MNQEKLLVLIINDMVIFPNNEVRIEYDNTFDKQMISIIEKLESDLMLIVNPIDDESDIDVTSLPNYGVLGRLKLKMNVPNGKTRIVIEGLKRIFSERGIDVVFTRSVISFYCNKFFHNMIPLFLIIS